MRDQPLQPIKDSGLLSTELVNQYVDDKKLPVFGGQQPIDALTPEQEKHAAITSYKFALESNEVTEGLSSDMGEELKNPMEIIAEHKVISNNRQLNLPPKIDPTRLKELSEDEILTKLLQDLQLSEPWIESGVSRARVLRARLLSQKLTEYSKEELQVLLYPVVYQMKMLGYMNDEIAAVLNLPVTRVRTILLEVRKMYHDELIKDISAEFKVSESVAYFDMIKADALKRAANATGNEATNLLKLAASVEAEKIRILDLTGHYDTVRRKNELEAAQAQDEGKRARDTLVDDIKEIFGVIEGDFVVTEPEMLEDGTI